MSDELIDIELPISPTMDWWFFIELTLLAFVLVIFVLAILWFRRIFWGSLKTQYLVKKQLKKLTLEQSCSVKQALQMNQLFMSVKKQPQLDEDSIQTLTIGFNALCFSGQDVPCETLQNLLNDFLDVLVKNQPSLIDTVKQNIKQFAWWQK